MDPQRPADFTYASGPEQHQDGSVLLEHEFWPPHGAPVLSWSPPNRERVIVKTEDEIDRATEHSSHVRELQSDGRAAVEHAFHSVLGQDSRIAPAPIVLAEPENSGPEGSYLELPITPESPAPANNLPFQPFSPQPWVSRPFVNNADVPILGPDNISSWLPRPEPSAERPQPRLEPINLSRQMRASHVLASNVFVCDVCALTFDSQSKLTHHRRCHQPYSERRHTCSVCHKRFQYRKDLTRHMRMHDRDLQRFFCSNGTCKYHQKGFSRLDHLQRHTRSFHHTGEYGDQGVSRSDGVYERLSDGLETPRTTHVTPRFSAPSIDSSRSRNSASSTVELAVINKAGTNATSISSHLHDRESHSSKSVSSRAPSDTGTLNLGETVNSSLAYFFAKQVFQALKKNDLTLQSARDSCVMALEDSLGGFAFMFAHSAQSKLATACARFVRRHSSSIVTTLRDICDELRHSDSVPQHDRSVSENPPDETTSSHERTKAWLDLLPETGKQDDTINASMAPCGTTVAPEEGYESSESGDGSEYDFGSLTSQVPAIQILLTQSQAWGWLIKRVERATHFTATSKSIHCRLLDFYANYKGSLGCVTYLIAWQPHKYLTEQFPPGTKLADIVVTTRDTDQCYTSSCSEYVTRVWPSLGESLLNLVSQPLSQDLTAVEHVDRGNGVLSATSGPTEGALSLTIHGTLSLQLDVGEQLAWLGAACTALGHSERSECRVLVIEPTHSRPQAPLTLSFSYKTENLQPSKDDGCWEGLFRNTSIASGFPVPLRNDQARGMEISLDAMLQLGETCWATVFNDRFMLKGFSTMFYPVVKASGFLVWHFIYHPEHKYLPHAAAFGSHLQTRTSAAVDADSLRLVRHFVGWASEARVNTGVRDGKYDVAEPGPSSGFSNISLERINVSAGKYVSIGATVARGRHHIPLWSVPYSEYLRDMVQASQETVLLYDAEERRAWLVDAASALLHLTIAQLKTSLEAKYWNKGILDQISYPSPDQAESCLEALLDRENRKLVLVEDDFGHEKDTKREDLEARTHLYRFQHLVHDNWKRLAQILEQHALKPAAMELRLSTQDRLAGWSFRGLVNSRALLTPKIFHLMSRGKGYGWVDFVKSINAAVLVGNGFGDIIQPASGTSNKLCQGWLTMPSDHDNLAVTISKLRRIAEASGCRFPTSLAKDVFWIRRDNIFEPCRCSSSASSGRCDPIQVLTSSRSRIPCSMPDVASAEEKGAVIFANSSDFKWSKLLNVFRPAEKDDASTISRSSSTLADSGYDSLSPAGRKADKSLGVDSMETDCTYPEPHDATCPKESDEGHDEDAGAAMDALPAYRSFVYAFDRPDHPGSKHSQPEASPIPRPSIDQTISSINSSVYKVAQLAPVQNDLLLWTTANIAGLTARNEPQMSGPSQPYAPPLTPGEHRLRREKRTLGSLDRSMDD